MNASKTANANSRHKILSISMKTTFLLPLGIIPHLHSPKQPSKFFRSITTNTLALLKQRKNGMISAKSQVRTVYRHHRTLSKTHHQSHQPKPKFIFRTFCIMHRNSLCCDDSRIGWVWTQNRDTQEAQPLCVPVMISPIFGYHTAQVVCNLRVSCYPSFVNLILISFLARLHRYKRAFYLENDMSFSLTLAIKIVTM